MTQTTAFISELIVAANALSATTPSKRRSLIEHGVAIVQAQRQLLLLNGNVVPLEPSFMADMQALAQMTDQKAGVEILVASGMLLLAEEIRRLRVLTKEASPPDTEC